MKSILAAVLFSLGVLVQTHGQVPAPLPVAVGTHTVESTKTVYSITASGQPGENLQEVQFRTATGGKTTVVTLRTGRQKTVGQVTALVGGVFQKFLAGQPANTTLGSLGSLKKGGEVLFVSESPEKLRFDFATPGLPPCSSVFGRADAEAFATILGVK